jgi:hypothetical protein
MASYGIRALAFSKLPLATLEATQTKLISAINAFAEGGQSYSISTGVINRTFNRGELTQVSDLLTDITSAIEIRNGNVRSRTYVDLSV